MPIVFDAPVEPDDFTAFIRDVPVPAEFTLLNEFPIIHEDDNTVDFAEIVRTNRTARYRSWDGRVHVSARDTASEKRVKLAPLSTSLSQGEYERLQREFARSGGTRQQVLERAIYNEAEQLTREVQARLEQAWGDVLTDGKLTIDENGLYNEADYGVPGTHIVAPTVQWTVANLATMTPITDLVAWSDVWAASNGGQRPSRLKTSLARLRIVQRSKEVIDAIYGATQGRTRVSVSELNDFLRGERLPAFDEPYDTAVDVDGSTVRTIADDKVVMLPANLGELGSTRMGVTATALELVDSEKSDMSFEQASGIVGVVFKEDGVPFRQYTYVDAAGMPVLTNARKLLVADVA